jgi:deoxyadenosine/deoxycytidine kinase
MLVAMLMDSRSGKASKVFTLRFCFSNHLIFAQGAYLPMDYKYYAGFLLCLHDLFEFFCLWTELARLSQCLIFSDSTVLPRSAIVSRSRQYEMAFHNLLSEYFSLYVQRYSKSCFSLSFSLFPDWSDSERHAVEDRRQAADASHG